MGQRNGASAAKVERELAAKPGLERQRNPQQRERLKQTGLGQRSGINGFETQFIGQLFNVAFRAGVAQKNSTGFSWPNAGFAMMFAPTVLNAFTTLAPR